MILFVGNSSEKKNLSINCYNKGGDHIDNVEQNQLFNQKKCMNSENTENHKVSIAKKREFSKDILIAVMGTYFVGLIVAIFFVIFTMFTYPEYAMQALGSMLVYIGGPVSVAIAFYSWKAKNENVQKIKNLNENHEGVNN